MKTPALKFISSRQPSGLRQSQSSADSPEQGSPVPVEFQSQQQQQQQQQQLTRELSEAPSLPSREDIELAAYRLYADRGFEEGHSLEHWLEAESSLLSPSAARVA